jgi:hypothetical protein
MKHRKIIGLLMIALSLTSIGQAQCRYFRVKYKLISCELDKMAPDKLPGVASSNPDDLNWLDQAPGNSVKFKCDCDYVLKGSDPLCDFDKNDEQTYTTETDNVQDTCRRGSNLCDQFCPRDLSS